MDVAMFILFALAVCGAWALVVWDEAENGERK